MMLEIKTGDSSPVPDFHYFERDLLKQNPSIKRIQLVKTLKRNYSTPTGLLVTNLEKWLEKWIFNMIYFRSKSGVQFMAC